MATASIAVKNRLLVGDILKSARGNLDILEAWQWDKTQVTDWLDQISWYAPLWGVDPEYLDTSSQREKGELKLGFVIKYIHYLVHWGLISDVSFQKNFPVSEGDADTLVASKYPETTYTGHELPVRTLYDAIGWILSITAVPPEGSEANQNNFIFPLIGLFGKWCSVLLPAELIPTMLHVAYWYEDVGWNPRWLRVLLGATPGVDQMLWSQDQNVWHKTPLNPAHAHITVPPPRSDTLTSRWSVSKEQEIYWGIRGWDILNQRQGALRRCGMVIKESQVHYIDRVGLCEADSGFGRCAETFIYIWMLQQKHAAFSSPLLLGHC